MMLAPDAAQRIAAPVLPIPVLPVPMVFALALLAFLLHRVLTGNTQRSLLALIAVCTLQSALLALVHYYEFLALRPLQPILATIIPPVAWLAFRQAAGDGKPKPWWLHLWSPAAALISLSLYRNALEAIIPLSFSLYGVMMLLHLGRGEESLPHSLLESGGKALWGWRIVALSLLASAAMDIWIAWQLASGQPVTMWVPSLVSSLSLLSLGALALTRAVESRRDDDEELRSLTPADAERDQAIIAQLDAHLVRHRPYLDPDLTLSRLSRRLVIPAKQLSAAINRVKRENVSRYINRYRIAEACRLLQAGDSVTAAMLESGFNTKSNFNREFLRIKQMPPSDWQARNTRTLALDQHHPSAP